MTAPKSLLKGFEKTVATIKPDPKKRLAISDPDTRGLYLRVTPAGMKTFTIVARDPSGKQVWREVGNADEITLTEARERAREGVKRIKAGEPPFPEDTPVVPPETFRKVSDDFLALYVKNKERPLRSAYEIERQFKSHLWPRWEKRVFVDIKRRDIAQMLDEVERDSGASMADHLLATLSKLMTWYAGRDDDYTSPIIRGMRRTKPSERKRKRMLSDDEIRLVWNAAGDAGVFGAIIKTCLLSAQRRDKVRLMRREDVDMETGRWSIPSEAREKANAGEITLPPLAVAVLKSCKEVKGNPYVFAVSKDKAFNGFSKEKVALDASIAKANGGKALQPWVIHDLRRTAKSLMSRAGVRPDISERVLGHVIHGVEGVYDRHPYEAEKAEALQKLAGLVSLILNPPKGNVVTMERGAA
jgi:integrase